MLAFPYIVTMARAAEISGELKQWHTVTLTLDGPQASEHEGWSWTPYAPATSYFAPGSAFAYWEKKRVAVELPVADTDRSHVRGPGAYGFNWWTSGGENRMADAPAKTYYASGLNHNLLFVIPEWNMVVVRMGVDGNPPMGKPQAWNGFFARLCQGVTP
ncbi:MAG: hypothetical protein NXI32_08245 [bacterium]|nr:hypothetical protein [bacterium]